MPNNELILNESPWLILVCLLVGATYAYFLYTKKSPWSNFTNYSLAVLRFILISFLCFLLLSPFIKLIKNSIEKPVYVVGIDNSQSLNYAMDSSSIGAMLKQISDNIDALSESRLEIITLDGGLATSANGIVFNHESSNINNLLRNIQKDYEGKNLVGVSLVTDGIYNQGVSPTYSTYNFPINTIGLGDTIAKKDINLNAIYYNKVAYQGNKFSMLAEISHTGFTGENIDISISNRGKIISRKRKTLASEGKLTNVEFILDASKEGIQHYRISVAPKDTEFTTVNNTRDAYIEVVKGKKKILLVATSPHPDIKAIRSALETNENYDFTLFIPGIAPVNIPADELYDLVIYHQMPSVNRPNLSLLDRHILPTSSRLYVVGRQTNLTAFNEGNQVVKIQQRSTKRDAVTPVLNSNFSKFSLNSDYQNLLESFPPVLAPFGNYALQGDAEVLFYQQFGTIETEKPLVAVRQFENNKAGVILADGIWQWRLQEFANTGEHVAFNEFITKLIQYLSSTDDKRRFRAYPVNQEFFDNQEILIEAEIYNALYEPVFNKKINIAITDESGVTNSYSFINSESNKRFKLSGLQQGVYQFTASTTLEGKRERSSGAFSIKKLQLESLNLTADHNLLRNLSEKSGGQFFYANQIPEAFASLNLGEAQSVIHSEQEFQPLINLKWLFFLILSIVSIEWFLRKFGGSY